MDQIALFDMPAGEPDRRPTAEQQILSGSIGAIRFGSTAPSFTLLCEVLADLAGRPTDSPEAPS